MDVIKEVWDKIYSFAQTHRNASLITGAGFALICISIIVINILKRRSSPTYKSSPPGNLTNLDIIMDRTN